MSLKKPTETLSRNFLRGFYGVRLITCHRHQTRFVHSAKNDFLTGTYSPLINNGKTPLVSNRHSHYLNSVHCNHQTLNRQQQLSPFQIGIRQLQDGNSPPDKDRSDVQKSESKPEETTAASLSIFQRFKLAYKEYGKTLVVVHIATSVVWYGAFLYAAKSGIDVVPILEKIGASEKFIKPFKASGVGDLAVAYLLYKLATPARYTVTIVGTQLTVKELRKRGYMEQPSEQDSLRNLVKEGRSQVKDKFDDMKDNVKDRVDNVKDRFEDRVDNVKDRFDNVKDRFEDRVDNVKERLDNVKDKFEDRVDNVKDRVDSVKGKWGERKGKSSEK